MLTVSFTHPSLTRAWTGILRRCFLSIPRDDKDDEHDELAWERMHCDLESFERCGYDVTSSYYLGTRFEYEVAQVLQSVAFDLQRTGGSYDRGVDLRGFWRAGGCSVPVVAQCKRLASPVGTVYLREMEGVLSRLPRQTLGLFASYRGYTLFATREHKLSEFPILLTTIDEDGLSLVRWNQAAHRLVPDVSFGTQYVMKPSSTTPGDLPQHKRTVVLLEKRRS